MEADNEVRETVLNYFILIIYRGTAAYPDPPADSRKHLWNSYSSDWIGMKMDSAKRGKRNRNIFNRNNADYVYSRCRGTIRLLEYDESRVCSIFDNHDSLYLYRYGNNRKNRTANALSWKVKRKAKLTRGGNEMSEYIKNFAFFGVLVSLLSYGIGISLKKTIQTPSFQSAVNRYNTYNLTLLSLKMAYVIYYEGAKYISYLLTPATICLAIPLYEQLELLKKNCKLILLGILSGVLTSLCSILALALLFGLSKAEDITLLPKSVTTQSEWAYQRNSEDMYQLQQPLLSLQVSASIFAQFINWEKCYGYF